MCDSEYCWCKGGRREEKDGYWSGGEGEWPDLPLGWPYQGEEDEEDS